MGMCAGLVPLVIVMRGGGGSRRMRCGGVGQWMWWWRIDVVCMSVFYGIIVLERMLVRLVPRAERMWILNRDDG